MGYRSKRRGSLPSITEAKYKNLLMSVVSKITHESSADVDNDLIRSVLQTFCLIYKCSFQNLLDRLKLRVCIAEIKSLLYSLNFPYCKSSVWTS